MKKTLFFSFILIGIFSSSCALKIHEHRMPSAVVDEYFHYNFDVESNWLDWSYDSHFYRITDGDLDPGMDVTNRGTLVGIPSITGATDFKVAVYGVDEGWWSWDDEWWDEAETDWLDSEWFTLFVTEASTNANCPSPSETGVTEVFVCAGTLTRDTLATGASFDLDLNFYIEPDLSLDYLLSSISFTIIYDATAFAFDDDELTSLVFSDLPKFFEASATFDNTTPGRLTISLATGIDEDLHYSGRLMNLPVHVLKDLPAGTLSFAVDELAISQMTDFTVTPTLAGVDGAVLTSSDAPTL